MVYQVAIGALLVGWLSTAPLVQLGLRVFHQSPVPGSAAYSLGIVAPALLALALFGSLRTNLTVSARSMILYVPLALLGAWTVISTFWSPVPDASASEALLLVCILNGGIWFGRALDVREQVLALFIAFQMLTISSAIVGVLSSTGRGLGGWNGVFGSRNTLGPVAVLAILVSACLVIIVRPSGQARFGVATCIAIDLIVLVMTGARTPIVAGVGAMLAVGLALVLDQRVESSTIRAGVPIAAAGVLAVSLAAVVLTAVKTSVLDSLLSDRPAVWRTVLDASSTRPMVGFGHRSLWYDKTFLDPLYIETGLVFDNAHNSVLEMLAGTGIVGAACVLSILIMAIVRPWRHLFEGCRDAGIVWICLGTFAVLENMTEAFIVYHSTFWLLAVAAATGSLSASPQPLARS